MATGTAGTVAREYHTHQVHYLRKDFSFADTGKVLTVGVLPAGAVMIKPMSGIDVQVAFTAADTKVIDVGTPANDDLYATDISLASIAFVALDETGVSFKVAVDTTIIATLALAGASNTAGEGSIIIAYTMRDGV